MSDLSALLVAAGAFPGSEKEMELYGQFVGTWDVLCTCDFGNARSRRIKGEWHFFWILGGRGIQDVLYEKDLPKDRFGTTIRCYYPAEHIWKLTWFQPGENEYVNMTGHKVGDDIVQTVTGDSNSVWRFTEIQKNSFLWYCEVFDNVCNCWKIVQKMECTRSNELQAVYTAGMGRSS